MKFIKFLIIALALTVSAHVASAQVRVGLQIGYGAPYHRVAYAPAYYTSPTYYDGPAYYNSPVYYRPGHHRGYYRAAYYRPVYRGYYGRGHFGHVYGRRW